MVQQVRTLVAKPDPSFESWRPRGRRRGSSSNNNPQVCSAMPVPIFSINIVKIFGCQVLYANCFRSNHFIIIGGIKLNVVLDVFIQTAFK